MSTLNKVNYSRENSKRIAKNTLFLYVRMLFLMFIGLFTSRIVLQVLGVEDYGIYNVVAGVVTVFSVISGSLSAAIQRFITYELGVGNRERLNKVFCISINVQIVLIIIIVILLETVGLWFLNNKMVIPKERMIAANWLFHFSVITFAINLWSIPYNAEIVAHEKMSVFAYISIFEGISKLCIAVLILYEPFDRLIYYGFLGLIISIIVRFIYSMYCKRHFEECHFSITYDKKLLHEIFGFSGWNFIGASSIVLRDHGGNIILNLFGGPAVNAARGIAMSVNSIIQGFTTNFMMSLNPQITKNYANGNHDYMFKLIFQGARLSFYIFYIVALPIIISAPFLLEIWLGTVPSHAASFTRLAIVLSLSECLATPLITAMLATGRIRDYQLIVGGCQLLNLPASYVLLYLGFAPESIFVVAIVISVLCEMLRLIMLNKMIGLSIKSFLKCVYFNVILVGIVSCIAPVVLEFFYPLSSIVSFFLLTLVSILSAAITIYFVGCTQSDRIVVHKAVKIIFSRIR